MTPAETNIDAVTTTDILPRQTESTQSGIASNKYNQVIIPRGKNVREQSDGRADVEIKELIYSQADDVVVWTEGSVIRGQKIMMGILSESKG